MPELHEPQRKSSFPENFCNDIVATMELLRKAVLFGVMLLCPSLWILAQNADISQLSTKASAGDTESAFALGIAYASGKGVRQDDGIAVNWLHVAAEKGFPPAQNLLGKMYQAGRGVPQDKTKALEWWIRAGAQGYAPAQFNIASAYFNGEGTGVSDQLAYVWFKVAAKAGDSDAREAVQRMESEHSRGWVQSAQFKLAEMSELGKEFPQDLGTTRSIYQEIATGPIIDTTLVVDANIRLAHMMLEGRGGPQEYQAAFHRCETAAHLNSGEGFGCMGGLAESNLLGSPDFEAAAKYYSQALRYGDSSKALRLAEFYETGLGVKQDNVEALCMYLVAEAHSGKSDTSRSQAIESRLSAAEILKAQSKARRYR
jgi:TPR repeat protein